MSRLAPLDLNNLTPEQKEVADAIRSGPRGGLRGPFEAWLRSPGLADRAQKLGEYCRFGSVTDGGRPHPRVGGLEVGEIVGQDGLR